MNNDDEKTLLFFVLVLLLRLRIVFEPVLASGYVLRLVAFLRFFVEHFARGTSLFPGGDAVQAHVELLTVVGMRVHGMRHVLAPARLGLFFRTREAVFQFHFVRFAAARPAGSRWPRTRARVLVEMQPVGAHDFRALALDTVVEHVAHLLVRMRKVSVTSRAQVVGLRVLQFGTFAAVHAERLVALVHFPVQRVENQSVRAQFRRRHAVLALVELVALYRVFVLAVLFRTLELLSIC